MSSAARKSPQADLNGRQKAAILCMVLGTESAAKLQKKLSPEESEAIGVEIARMHAVDSGLAEGVLKEWLDLLGVADSIAHGGIDYAQKMLEQAYGPQQASAMLKRIQTQLADTAGLHRLRNADPAQLSTMLRNEHPQTIALILAHLQPTQTATVLKELAPELGAEVVYRMATMAKVSPDMLQLVERSIWTEDLETQQGLSTSGGPQAVASILALVPSSSEKTLLEGVSQRDAQLAQQIRDLMFVFEDIATLDDKSVQRLLREVEVKSLALALKGASEQLTKKIMGGMSSRAVATLQEEMENLGPQRKRDVEKAQAAVVTALRTLEEAGEIVLASASDDVLS
ncbi:MAG: flagellar motor switch protein FliG [Gemmatimonadaceae bacterium]|nr:flagellar motor switch protein FliG [Gemmatimonadaceae bacterium]